MNIRQGAALAAAVGLLSAGGVSWAKGAGPVDTVDEVDLERYDGLWYEIARTPNIFEIGCFCTTATYSVQSEAVLNVLNACNRVVPQGPLSTAEGLAVIPDLSEPGQLKLVLNGPSVPADYWIVDLVEDPENPEGHYAFSTVSGPNRDFIFILARQPTLTTEEEKRTFLEIVQRLQEQHLPVGDLVPTRQPSDCTYEGRR